MSIHNDADTTLWPRPCLAGHCQTPLKRVIIGTTMTRSSAYPSTITRLTLLLVSSLTVMAGTAISPDLPFIAAHFTATPHAAFLSRLMLAAPALAIALTAGLAGALIDHTGRVKTLLLGLLCYGMAGSAGLWLSSLEGLVISRVLLGLSIAILMTTATTLVSDYLSGPAREHFMGWQAAFMGFGGTAYLVIGGALAAAHWRAPFGLYLTALALLPLAYVTLREPNRGSLPHIAATDDPPVRHAVPRHLLHGFAALTFIAFFQVPTQLPFLLGQHGISDPAWTGALLATMNLFAASTALFYGRIRTRLSFPNISALAFGLFMLGFLMIGLTSDDTLMIPGIAIAGIGLGLSMPNLMIWLMACVPVARRGRAIGGQTAGVFAGQFLAPLLAQPLITGYGPGASFVGAAILTGCAAAGLGVWAARS